MRKRGIAALGIGLLLTAIVAFGARKPEQKVLVAPQVKIEPAVPVHIYPIFLGSQGLVFNLQDVPSNMGWAIGVRVEPWVVPGAEVVLLGKPLQVGNLSADSVQVTPGTMTLRGLRSCSGRKLVVYAVLPRPLPVRIVKDGVTVATATFNKGFMVRNGQVLAQVPESLISVVAGFSPNLISISRGKLGHVGSGINR